MKRPWHHRFRHSLRWRLLAMFALFTLGVAAIFTAGMQRFVHAGWESYARPMAGDYADRLAAEIGSPPDKDRAIALAARLPLTIAIDGPRVRFDSHPGRHRGPELERTTADGHVLRFGLAGSLPSDRPRIFGWTTLVLLLTLTAAVYWGVHRMLRPIADIGAGAQRFGRGDFADPIAVRRDDELGELAGRINGMAASLSNMLDAKRALLLAISHELRSPLTRARVNAELVPDSDEKAALLRDLGEMRDLITDLLESERLAQGHAALKPQRVDLPALVRETVTQQFPQAAVSLRIDNSIGTIEADPARLRLLLRNLVANALRHAAGAPQPPRVTLRRTDDDEIELSVRDFGPGVEPEVVEKLAQAFYRPDSARTRNAGGVGLGLYLCRLVAEAHEGRLVITREEPGLQAALVFRSLSTP